MSETCEELEAALDRAGQAVIDRQAELDEATAQAAALDAQLNALADSWSQGSHQGDWHEYGYALETGWREAQRDLDAARADTDGSDDTASQLDQAWTDLENALAEAQDIEEEWLSVMAQLTGDSPTDMGVPQSSLMDRATDLRERLDAALARVEECHRRIADLTARAQEDGAAAVEAAQAALEVASEARDNWVDASRDLIGELNAVPVDVRTRALESARKSELEALARWEELCGEGPEYEDEDGGTDTGLDEDVDDE